MDKTVFISSGNEKIGNIPNVSLPPIISCAPNVPCSRHCYAIRAFKQYPDVRKAWEANLWWATMKPDHYFQEIDHFLTNKNPRWFRWHVSGDILNQDYLDEMVLLAHRHPLTNFLAFTKRHDLKYDKHPIAQNLIIRFSYWPMWGVCTGNELVAYLKDDEEKRFQNGFRCKGSCKNCKACWNKNVKAIELPRHSNIKWVNPRQLCLPFNYSL